MHSETIPERPQKVHGVEALALAKDGRFQQAALRAEQAAAQAATQAATLNWHLTAARNWIQYVRMRQMPRAMRAEVQSRVEENLRSAKRAGAPAKHVALVSALWASLENNVDEILRNTEHVLDAPLMEGYLLAEALELKLETLRRNDRLDDAIFCYELVVIVLAADNLAQNSDVFLQLRAAWLRVLCDAQLATDDDVDLFHQAIRGSTMLAPEARLQITQTVAIHLYVAAGKETSIDGRKRLIWMIRTGRTGHAPLVEWAKLTMKFAESPPLNPQLLSAYQDSMKRILVPPGLDVGDRLTQAIATFELAFGIARETDSYEQRLHVAWQIAELSAYNGWSEKVHFYLRECDSVLDAMEPDSGKNSIPVASRMRARCLFAKGRILLQLAKKLRKENQLWQPSLVSCKASLIAAIALAKKSQNSKDLDGYISRVLSWLNEAESLLV